MYAKYVKILIYMYYNNTNMINKIKCSLYNTAAYFSKGYVGYFQEKEYHYNELVFTLRANSRINLVPNKESI